MKSKLILLSYLITSVLLLSCSAKKNLFILSGQSNMVGLDPEESFIPKLVAEFGKENVIVVKDALGSQSISRWYKNWKSPSGESVDLKGDLYDKLMNKVYDSIKETKLKSVTFIWMQGERDARLAYGEVYEQSLLGLYEQLCNDLNSKDVNFIVGRLSDFDMLNGKWPHWVMIRDIQVKVGESNPRFGWVNTDDLNDGYNRAGKAINNDLHMSAEGYKILGERFAEKSIKLISDNN